MERATTSWMVLGWHFGGSQRGASIVEAVIALPILLVVILGAIQFGFVYQAKATLNHASLQAARLGAVRNADPEAIRRGLARGLTALHSPEASLAAFARTRMNVETNLATDARIRILNPTREAFDDFAIDVDGEREIPNGRLHTRSTTVGSHSGINIQDANLLKVQITYGYELRVPLVNWFIARVLLGVSGGVDTFERQLLRRTRLPIMATATVRMQSPARLSDAVVSRSDFPDLERIPSDAPPRPVSAADEAEEGDAPGDHEPGSGGEELEDAAGLDEGFMGFGGGDPGASGSAGDEAGSNDDGGAGGGLNGGNPLQCPVAGGEPAPFPFDAASPGQSNPLPQAPELTPDGFDARGASGSGASIESVSLASLSVGNPIHVATGNKFQTEVDLDPLPGVLGIEFRRHYNSSAVNESSVVGAGWRHSYQATLRRRANSIEIVQADGRLIVFRDEAASLPPPATPALLPLVWERSREARASGRRNGAAVFIAQRASDGLLIPSGAGFRWIWRSGRELEFDADGRLVRIMDQGRDLVLRYVAGSLVSVTDPHDRELRFEYYPTGRLARVRAPGAQGAAYRYDGAGNLVQVTSVDGSARRYTYEDERHPHHLSSISFGSVRPRAYGERTVFEPVASWAYDERGRAVYSAHPDDAGKVTLAFENGYTDVTDAFGRTTRYVIGRKNGIAYVTEVRGPGCGSCARGDVRYAYDDRFQLLLVATKRAQALHYRHDDEARIVQVDREIGARRDWIVRYAYEDSTSRVSRIERPSVKKGAVTVVELAYAANGLLARVRELGFSPDGEAYREIAREVQVAYDAQGRMRRIDGPRNDVSDWMDFEYDDLDRVVAIETPAGSTKMLAFDASGRPTHIAQTGRPDLKLTYDARGRVTSAVRLRAQGKLESFFSYDDAGRLAQVVDAQGRRVRYGFDAAGRPNRMSSSDSGVTTIARYAPDDRIERIAVLGAKGQLLRTLYYVYDSERRLTEVRDGEGQPLRQLAYVDSDRLADRTTDPLGYVTGLTYDALGRLAALLAPDGGITSFERDEFGRTTRLIAPNDSNTAFLYDDFGRRVRERSADRGETKYAYDPAGNLVEKVDARGATTRLTYDAANRLIQVERAEGTTRLSYTEGLLTHVDGEVADERYEYDRDAQLVAHRRKIGARTFTTRFSYDARGRLEARELPSGARLRYRYASNGTLRSVMQEGWRGGRVLVHSTETKWAAAAALRASGSLTYGNGVSMHTTFDARSGHLKRREVESVAKLAYEHDEAGRITSIRRDGDAGEYEYDAIGRLARASTRHAGFDFAYDTNGNRVSASTSPRAQRTMVGEGARSHRDSNSSRRSAYEYAPGTNRLVSIGDATRYTYDAAGNPLIIGMRRHEYDTSGRLTRLYESNRLIAEYRYNFWGERVQKVVHTGGRRIVTSYIYEQQKLIAEADEQGDVTREYVYLEHHPVALLERGRLYWIHTDHLGTPIAVTNDRRTVVWQADHQPFGKAVTDEDPDDDTKLLTLNLRFPGQYADAESGTHYNYFRDYDPETGRYLTADPIGVVGGTNAFAYAGNRPVMAFDSLGLYQEDVHYYMTLFLAVTAGVDPQAARHMALASAFVDINAATRPTDESNDFSTALSALANQPQLLLYHFVLSDPEDGETLQQYRNGNYHSVATNLSPQLAAMLGYATLPPRYVEGHSTCGSDGANLQFFGEFLHAMADTYSHRDSNDRPYDALGIGLGFGHAVGWHWPDYTHNEDGWITREARTFAMELDLRDAIRNSQWANPLRSTTDQQFETLVAILREFNATRENEQLLESLGGDRTTSELWVHSQKIALLNEGLRQLGYDSVDLTSEEFSFNEAEARRLREQSFFGLDRSRYVDAILETRR